MFQLMNTMTCIALMLAGVALGVLWRQEEYRGQL
jgi:hypothetical protein